MFSLILKIHNRWTPDILAETSLTDAAVLRLTPHKGGSLITRQQDTAGSTIVECCPLAASVDF